MTHRAPSLVEALEACQARFREYEAGHKEKAEFTTLNSTHLDALAKAKRNADMADMCAQALAAYREREGEAVALAVRALKACQPFIMRAAEAGETADEAYHLLAAAIAALSPTPLGDDGSGGEGLSPSRIGGETLGATPKSAAAEALLHELEMEFEAIHDDVFVPFRLGAIRAALADLSSAKRADHDGERSVLEWNRQRVCKAASTASMAWGQWVPQAWLDHFMKAYEADQ